MKPRGPLRRALDALELGAVRAAMAATARMSTPRFLALAEGLGRRAAPRLPPARRRVRDNLRALGRDEADAADLTARVGAHFARVVAQYWRMEDLAAQPELLRIDGAEHVKGPLAEGRGLVIASAHFGHWEGVRLAVRAATGRDCAIIYRAFNNPRVDAMAQRCIASAGEPVLHKGREGTRALLRHVARGGAAMVLVDQRQTGSPLIPFLGREAETATAAAELARRFGAALVTARARRDGDGFEVRFEPEITAATSEAMMAEVNARIGAWVEADPEQWFWLHRRWKLRGRGDRMRAARREGGAE